MRQSKMATTNFLIGKLFLLWFVSLRFKPVHSGHIVGFANLDFVSHNRLLWKLGKELQSRGHKYTQLLPSCTKERFYDVHVKLFKTSLTNQEIEECFLKYAKVGDWRNISGLMKLTTFSLEYGSIIKRFCEDFLKHETLIEELKKSVDLVVCDFTNDCCYILADLLNVTRVDVSPFGFAREYGAYLFGNPQAPLYLTLESSSQSSDTSKFSFTNRLRTFMLYTFLWQLFNYPNLENLWETYGKANSNYKYAMDARRTHSIGLIPHDFAMEHSRPLGANIKVIGPILPDPARKLPEYLNEFMTKNDDVVLVSFGTILSNYPSGIVQVIADGLSKLSAAVLWIYSGNIPKNLGNNIKIMSWIPQNESSLNDVLGHQSIKVFVTHGGLNSFQESVYHSVPMVVIPLFGDQYKQARIVELKRIGVSLDRKIMTAEELTSTINEVLNNKVYKKNANKISALINDRKNTPTEEGAGWIEYALRHDGAPHLTSEALDLPEYQLHMFDVFLFLLIVIFITLFIFVYVCCCICCGKMRKPAKEKQT